MRKPTWVGSRAAGKPVKEAADGCRMYFACRVIFVVLCVLVLCGVLSWANAPAPGYPVRLIVLVPGYPFSDQGHQRIGIQVELALVVVHPTSSAIGDVEQLRGHASPASRRELLHV